MTKRRVAVAAIALLLLIGGMMFFRRGQARRAVTPTDAHRALAAELRRDVAALCANGPRSIYADGALAAAADYIEQSLPMYRVERQSFPVQELAAENLIVEIRGAKKPEEIVVVGAHYDSVDGSPGADDNASGVAGLLAIARRFEKARPGRTVRFVFFANEEPPHFQTRTMGSWHYARRCRQREENVVAMLSLEMLGYYDPKPGSQVYPGPLAALYPNTADFIGFTGNIGSRALVKRSVGAFRARTSFPAESAVLPELIPQVGWSDQWSFWQFGYPAIMITDTALFRNPYYHTPADLPGTLDYQRMAMVVEGLHGMVEELAT